jgi:hypothetical protein
MKNVIFILFFLFISQKGFCQGNLQFNRVFTLSSNPTLIPANTKANVLTFTVPQGKIWKVEGVSLIDDDDFISANFGISINNFNLKMVNSALAVIENLPYWVEPGTHSVFVSFANSGGFNVVASLNVIEYNIIP